MSRESAPAAVSVPSKAKLASSPASSAPHAASANRATVNTDTASIFMVCIIRHPPARYNIGRNCRATGIPHPHLKTKSVAILFHRRRYAKRYLPLSVEPA